MSEWSKESEPLTPNHLLTMKNKTLLPPPGNFVKEEVYVQKRWRKVQFLAEQFWSRWWKDYLLSVNPRQKWFRPKRNLKIGNIVIVQEVLRNKWPLGKIMPIGDFNRSTRFFSFCEDKAWILKKGIWHKFLYHQNTSAKSGPHVGRRGLRQVPMAMFDVHSEIIQDLTLRPLLES